MVRAIRIYVEGGGEGKDGKALMRRGFGEFLGELCARARERRIHWNIIACGPRNAAFDGFLTALRTHPDAFNVLLVDSEGPVTQPLWNHFRSKDGWNTPNISEDHCHLMVQVMEAWFIADVDTLVRFYGTDFRRGAIPRQRDVEAIDKKRIERALRDATRSTQKGAYQKIRHGAELLRRIVPERVRSRAYHCDRLFFTLAEKMETEV
jgi:hypothetical protein